MPGPFRGGSSYGASYADFAQSWDPINSYQQGSNGGSYTVRAGDTLGSIAAQLWGDSSLWYKLGEANGIAGAGALNEGQVLIVPSGVSKSTHNAGTFQPYDPAEALGDTSPTAPKPPKHNKCGVLGAVLLVAVAVAVTVLTRLPVAKFFAGVLGGSTTAGGIVGGVVTGAAASAASQGVGIVTGIQQGGFSWKSVALAAVSGGVGGGLGGDKLFGIKSGLLEGAVRGVVGNVLGQGIGIATRLQSKFDWAGAAAAGVSGGVGGVLGGGVDLSRNASAGAIATSVGVGTARAIAGAAARSLIEGTSFGDNVLAVLPDAIGQTIGELVAGEIAGRGGGGPINPLEEVRDGSSSSSADADGEDVVIVVTGSRGTSTLWFGGNAAMMALAIQDPQDSDIGKVSEAIIYDEGSRFSGKSRPINGARDILDHATALLDNMRRSDFFYEDDPWEAVKVLEWAYIYQDDIGENFAPIADYLLEVVGRMDAPSAFADVMRATLTRDDLTNVASYMNAMASVSGDYFPLYVAAMDAKGTPLSPLQQFLKLPLSGDFYAVETPMSVFDYPPAKPRILRWNFTPGGILAGAAELAAYVPAGRLAQLRNARLAVAAESVGGLETLGPGWRVLAPAGEGAATGPLPKGYRMVSRWVGPNEAAAWMGERGTGIPTISGSKRMYVTELGAAKPGGTGPIRVDFAVPEGALQRAGKSEWFQIFQPAPSRPVYNVQIHVPEGTKVPGY